MMNFAKKQKTFSLFQMLRYYRDEARVASIFTLLYNNLIHVKAKHFLFGFYVEF
jgi:transposase